MSITIEWLVEGHICLVSLPAVIVRAAMLAYDDDLVVRLDAALGKIHLIADLRYLKRIPPIREVVKAHHVHHPRLGQILTLGMTRNFIGRFFFTLGAQMAGLQHRDFNTLDQARAYLYQVEGV